MCESDRELEEASFIYENVLCVDDTTDVVV